MFASKLICFGKKQEMSNNVPPVREYDLCSRYYFDMYNSLIIRGKVPPNKKDRDALDRWMAHMGKSFYFDMYDSLIITN